MAFEDDIVMLHMGWDKYHGRTPEYLFEFPYLTDDAAEYLASFRPKAVGADGASVCPWVDEAPAHGPAMTKTMRDDPISRYWRTTSSPSKSSEPSTKCWTAPGPAVRTSCIRPSTTTTRVAHQSILLGSSDRSSDTWHRGVNCLPRWRNR